MHTYQLGIPKKNNIADVRSPWFTATELDTTSSFTVSRGNSGKMNIVVALVLTLFTLVFGQTGEPLLLTPYIESGNLAEGRNASRVGTLKEGIDVESYSGYITVDSHYDANLFFWFFPAETNRSKAPFIIYLEGGPGATTFIGFFLLNGAYYINSSNELDLREDRWSKDYNVLFVDNPVGTGYSYTKNEGGYSTNEVDVGENLYNFIVQFFKLFPEFAKNEFYITGESYGAKYSCVLGYAIHHKNPSSRRKINLKGIAIASPFLDPEHQMNFADFWFEIGLIDDNTRKVYLHKESAIVRLIRAEQYEEALALFLEYFQSFQNVTGYQYLYNYQFWRFDNDDRYIDYVQSDTVRSALHVGNNTFNDGQKVYEKMKADFLQSVKFWFKELAEKYRIILFSGQYDLAVPYVQIPNFLNHLRWSGSLAYRTAVRTPWYVEGDLAGYTKIAGKLTEVMVRNSGHFVIVEQRKWVLDLLSRFIKNESFS